MHSSFVFFFIKNPSELVLKPNEYILSPTSSTDSTCQCYDCSLAQLHRSVIQYNSIHSDPIRSDPMRGQFNNSKRIARRTNRGPIPNGVVHAVVAVAVAAVVALLMLSLSLLLL